MRPHRRQPTRLHRPRDSPGKNTGVGCHFLLQCMKVKVKSLSRIRLLATPWTAAHQAPPSMGFSRQEYWSGMPLPSPMLLAVPQKLAVPQTNGVLVCPHKPLSQSSGKEGTALCSQPVSCPGFLLWLTTPCSIQLLSSQLEMWWLISAQGTWRRALKGQVASLRHQDDSFCTW